MKHKKYSMSGFFWGLAASVAAMIIAAFFFPPFREGISAGSEWLIGTNSFGFPAILIVFTILFCTPGALAGLLITRFVKSRRSLRVGYICIALGVLWHAHLYVLNEDIIKVGGKIGSYKVDSGRPLIDFLINIEYSLLLNTPQWFDYIIPLFPAILGIGVALLANRFEHEKDMSRQVRSNT